MSPPPPPRRAALLILVASLAAAATYLPTALAAKPPPGPLYAAGTTPVSDLSADEYRASIRPDGAGRRIDQVLGVSLEWPRVGDYENERFARVFALLGPRPILRIGGSSAEMLDEVPGPATWRALRYLAQRAGARFIINLKLSGGDLDFIKALYKRSIAEVGPYVRAFELGNEPEYWPKGTGGYALAPPHAFTPGWPAFNEYYSTVARALVAVDASYPILGPSWAHFKSGIDESLLRAFISAAAGTNLKELAFHWYPAFTSVGFTVEDLLGEGLMRQAVDDFHNLRVWGGGRPVRMTEGNSKSRGGIAGVSDTFGAALWTADYAFEMAAAGAPGVNLHWRIGGEPNNTPGPHWPCYYLGVETGYKKGASGALETFPKARAPWAGYLLFARATLPRSGGDGTARLAQVPSAAAGGACDHVKLWPLGVSSGSGGGGGLAEVRVALLNKRPGGSCRVVLRLEPPVGYSGGGAGGAAQQQQRYGAATVEYMLPGGGDAAAAAALASGGSAAAAAAAAVGAAGLSSTRGDATIGGQVMDADGRLAPSAPRAFTVAAKRQAGVDGGTEYTLTLPGSSGTLLTVPYGAA